MNYITYLINSLPLGVALVVWAVHLEKKITRIETDIAWMKKESAGWRQTSADNTP